MAPTNEADRNGRIVMRLNQDQADIGFATRLSHPRRAPNLIGLFIRQCGKTASSTTCVPLSEPNCQYPLI